jgi:type II secretory pathway component PulF
MEKKSHNKEQIFVIALLVVMLLMFIVIPTFAQSTNTLDLDVSNITPNLFLGANIMIAALLAVMMLVAGLTFGMNILSRIVRAIVSGIR